MSRLATTDCDLCRKGTLHNAAEHRANQRMWLIVDLTTGRPVASVVPGQYPMSAVRQYITHNPTASVATRPSQEGR